MSFNSSPLGQIGGSQSKVVIGKRALLMSKLMINYGEDTTKAKKDVFRYLVFIFEPFSNFKIIAPIATINLLLPGEKATCYLHSKEMKNP